MKRSLVMTCTFALAAVVLLSCRPRDESGKSESFKDEKPKSTERRFTKAELEKGIKPLEITHDQIPPPIVGLNSKGETMRLSDYRGKVVMLDFWYSGCGPCLEMIPHEREMVQALKDKPFVLLGVNNDAGLGAMVNVEKRMQVNWNSWRDFDKAIFLAYRERWPKMHGWPSIFLIDHKGRVRYFFPRAVRGQALDYVIDKLLAEAE